MFRLLLTSAMVALHCPQDTPDLDRLVGSLGSESVDARQKAEDRLIELGQKSLPALRKAAAGLDQEVRSRAQAAIAEIDRLERERLHDSEERAAVLKESDMANAKEKEDKYWQVAWTDGAVFRFGVRSWKGGTVLTTHFRNYLAKKYEEGLSDIKFDIVGITGKDGKELVVERCGACSPYFVYAKDAEGPITVHVKGSHLWWSTHVLEYLEPKDGDRKKVGDFTIEVVWPTLKVTSRRPYPKDLFSRSCSEFSYEVKPGVARRPSLFDEMGVRVGGGGGGVRGGVGDEWCHCKGGPKPVLEQPKGDLVSEFVMKKERRYVNPLPDVAKIEVWIHKPIVEPIDFSQVVTPK